MDATKWSIAVVVIVVLGAGAFLLSMPKNVDVMEKKDSMKDEGAAMDQAKDEMMAEGNAMEKSDETMTEKREEVMMKKDDGAMMEKKDEGAMMQKGSYEAYAPEKLANATAGDVVLFFRASWCPSCRTLDTDIKANAGSIPSGLTILDVNYDDSTALKQKYGVTSQHTLVQVDATGNMITKWSGGSTLASIVAKVQ